MEPKKEVLAEKNKTRILSDSIKKFFHNLFLYISLVLAGIVAAAFYFRNTVAAPQIEIYKAGEVSVSLNEKSELVFIHRDKGQPLIIDSTLTEVINNMLAARDYVKVNTLR